jgi:hypothetical protein
MDDGFTITITNGSCLDDGSCHHAYLVPSWLWTGAGGLIALVLIITIVALLRRRTV